MPYGRGGAGNFEAAAAAKQLAQERAANDVEAQKSTEDHLSDVLSEAKPPAQYAHSGRGGAGNYYSPQELSKTGQFEGGTAGLEEASIPTSAASKIQAKIQATLPAYRGRGGAGNYETSAADSAEAARSKAVEEEKEEQKIRESIAKDVETGLAKPQKAKLPGFE
ncbi:hypothetical protein CAC42_4416 [Sphaceloma murrayae]|uniref:Uncharacterized protein n=1 Tax=Sphaceloma murrayae TaxID=2082308 RepID=A0A2K1QLI4_9PEZI|nr:hypothetical protein CAC42_4416 [Sphaceloma murrayae]